MSRMLLIACCVTGLALAQTNPNQKEDYLDHAAHRVRQTHCERYPQGPLCLPPLLVRGVLGLNTEPPRDYVIFTLYTTRLGDREIRALGIGRRFILWSSQENST